jgi:PKHD-type hydroxylase
MTQPQPPKIFFVQNLVIVPNAIPDNKITALKEYQKRFASNVETAKVGSIPESIDVDGKKGKRKDIRSCEISWIFPDAKFTTELTGMVNQQIMNVAYQSYGFDVHRMEPLQYTHYTYHEDNEVKDHYDWHTDSALQTRPVPFDRKVSASIQLSDSDEYEGCDLEFPGFTKLLDQDLDIEIGHEIQTLEPVDVKTIKTLLRQKGTAIFFPSMFFHRVTPIKSGERFALVVWLQGPKYR